MPYRRRRAYKKKKFNLGRKLAKRGSIYGSAAQQLWKDVKMLKDFVNVEFKVWDNTLSQTATTTLTNCQWLSPITTGTGYNNRTGMVVKAARLYHSVTLALGGAETKSRVRVILFYNRRLDHGALIPTSAILQNPALADSPINLDNVGDIKIIYDRLIMLDTAVRPFTTIRFNTKLGHHIRWDTSGDLITDTESGHIFCLYVGDNYASTAPTVATNSRLRFIDN